MLNRNSIRDGIVHKLLLQNRHLLDSRPKSEAERLASLRATLARAPAGDVWLFGYGSLMWNPAIDYAERRRGRIFGYHRAYCIWSHLGRGSPERPGLMLGLDRGGSCGGVAYRLAPERLEEELAIVWAREMSLDAYRPTWLAIHTADGPVSGLAFAVNRGFARYAGRLPPDVVARHLAGARGYLGSSAEYLANTVAHLAELGIHDATLHDLQRRVTRLQAEDRAG